MHKPILKRILLTLPAALMLLGMLVFSSCNKTPSGPGNGGNPSDDGGTDTTDTTDTTGTDTTDIGGEAGVLYDFDDGTAQGWTLNDPEFLVKTDQFFSGDYALGATTLNNGHETVAFIEPEELGDDGNQITAFSYYYRETTDNSGAGIRLLDASGNMVVATATGNPNYNTFGAGGFEAHDKPTSSDYDVWVHVEIAFDWQGSTADITFSDTESAVSKTYVVDLAKTTGVKRIEIADYHSPELGGFYLGDSGAFYYWADDISFTTGDPAVPDDGNSDDGNTDDDLITNINAASGSTYQLDTLSVGTKVYVDRDYTFLEVPSAYDGVPYIQTANDDKSASDALFLGFDLAREATVAVLYDNRLSRPSWLSDANGWVDTGKDIKSGSSDSPLVSRIYEQKFSAGTVTLGGNSSTVNNASMYSVAITDGQGLGACQSDCGSGNNDDDGPDMAVSTPSSKPNLIVLTDISSITTSEVGEPDDAQTMVRLMVYSNEFDIKGLVASSTLRHGATTHADFITDIVEAYGQDRGSLTQHASGYPTEQELKDVIKTGRGGIDENTAVSAMIGNNKDTEASNWIIQKVDDASASDPIWFAIWGGPADLAQALWKVRDTRNASQVSNFVSKIRVIASGDQDKTGPWIKSNFSDLYYITSFIQGRGFFREGDMSLVSPQWVQQHIRGHGALGDFYPNYDGGGRFGKVKGIKSGDSHTIMGLIRNGLNLRNYPTWLNWGGQRKQVNGDPYRYGPVTVDVPVSNLSKKLKPVWRWRPAYQADFQARLDWIIKSYGSANHNPERQDAELNEREVTAGDNIILHAGSWSDPDNDQLNYHWTVAPEEGSYSGNVSIDNNHSKSSAHFTAPSVSRPETVHVLLTVTDDGTPNLYTYRRFIFTVNP